MKDNELFAQIQIAHLIKKCFILLLIAAVYCLFWLVLDPYFVYFEIPKGVEAIVVACLIAVPWAWQVASTNRKKIKQAESNAESTAQTNKKYFVLFGGACAVVGLYFLIHQADHLDQINQINHAKQLVVDAMEHSCAEKCALYGIDRADLLGPQVVHANTFEPHSGKHDYVFSWQSKKPAVKVTGHVYNFNGQSWVEPQVIALSWFGTPIPQAVLDANAPDAPPNYTAIRGDFKEVIEDAEPEINNAFLRAKLGAPKIQGEVTVHIMINSFGQVTAASVESSDVENPEFENNLIFIIKGLDFKSGPYAVMEKNYTFNFTRNGLE